MKGLLLGTALVLVAVATTGAYHLTQKSQIYYYQGHDRFARGDYAGAIPFYVQSVSENHRNSKALTELGYAYFWSGKPQESILTFQHLLSFQSTSYEIQKTLAKLFAWSKDYDKAIAIYREILGENPEDGEARRGLAETYLWAAQYDKAKEILAAILEKNPGDARAKFLYAKALQFSGENEKAIRIYEELLGRTSSGKKAAS